LYAWGDLREGRHVGHGFLSLGLSTL
jgi:hypothetical protein